MPIYEYTCEACHKKFDQLARRMGGNDSVSCPQCGSPKTARSLSVFAVGGDPAGKAASDAPPMCGRCGGAPGSCGMD